MITEEIRDLPNIDGDEGVLAIVVMCSYLGQEYPKGCTFITHPELPLQVAVMCRPAGEIIPPHTHPVSTRRILSQTQEVLYIKRGSLKVDFYNHRFLLVCSRTLSAGDLVIFIAGGHGFQMLDECEIIEVKQGPYIPTDKVPIL